MVLFITLLACLSLFYWTLRLGISPMPSSRHVQRALVRKLPLSYEGTIYDLGSGVGTMLLFFSRRYPKCKIIGYELSLIPYLISRVLLFGRKNVEIRRKDFRKERLEAGWCYLYLFSSGTRSLSHTLFQGSLVISNTFQLSLPYTEAVPLSDLWRSSLYFYNMKCIKSRLSMGP